MPEFIKGVRIEFVKRSPLQHRQEFDQASLGELAASIKASGIVQPVVVRKHGEGYELIAGERRWRAAQLAGLDRLDLIVREESDLDSLLLGLVENLQRKDINPLEEAHACRLLREEYGKSDEEIGKAIGKDRSRVHRMRSLLNMDREVQDLIRQGSLAFGHAKLLLALPHENQRALAQETVRKRLSVKALRQKIKGQLVQETLEEDPCADPSVRRLEDDLSGTVGAPVSITSVEGNKKKYKITITCFSLDELEGVLGHIK